MGIISILISVLSFLMSAFSLASTYYEKHIKTKCYLRWVSQLSTGPNRSQLTISLLISNMSSRPSTITNILLKNQNEYVESTWCPVILLESSDSLKTCYSDCTPLNVPSRSAKEFIVVFQYLQGFKLEDTINFSFIIDEREINKTLPVKLILDGDQAAMAMNIRLT